MKEEYIVVKLDKNNVIDRVEKEQMEKWYLALLDIKEYIEKHSSFINYLSPTREKEIGSLEMRNVKKLLDIVNKAIGGKDE